MSKLEIYNKEGKLLGVLDESKELGEDLTTTEEWAGERDKDEEDSVEEASRRKAKKAKKPRKPGKSVMKWRSY